MILDNLCILPWIHIEADAKGRAKPCCLYEGDLGNFAEENLSDIWNGEKITSLREDFLQDNRPIGCRQCWTTEDVNGESKRLRDNFRFRHHQQRFDLPIDKILPPTYYDLKLGTVCNLKCRTCSTASSFKWEEDEVMLYGESLNPNVKSYWISDEAPIWKELSENLEYTESFDFSGGEPFLIKRHVELLKECVDKNVAKNITIHYNTNGSIMPSKELQELWQEFKDIDVMVSMDCIGDRFEYMRHPAKWNVVEHNFDFFNFQYYITASICYTISIFSLYYMPEFIQWAKDKELDDNQYFFNLMAAPTYLSIKNIPPASYKTFEQQLAGYDDAKQFLDIMKSEYMDERERFNWVTDSVDKFRSENWATTFPEIYKLIR
jgi:MoaA/NifB/PqqE/SkfB family radical SAM enzyme